MTNTHLIILSVVVLAFLYFGAKYVAKLQAELEYKKVKLTCVIEPTETGYSAYCKEIDGIIAVGSTIAEVHADFEESFRLWLHYTEGEHKGMWGSDFEITYVEE
jgi:predicted RNase H-like HicB family nuclease